MDVFLRLKNGRIITICENKGSGVATGTPSVRRRGLACPSGGGVPPFPPSLAAGADGSPAVRTCDSVLCRAARRDSQG